MTDGFRNRQENRVEINQSGFTILELMISTTIFSLVLMGCLAGILQITRMYYQGVTQIRTQEVMRALTDEVGESIRFSKNKIHIPEEPTTPTTGDVNDIARYICIGTKRYSFYIDKQLSLNPNIDNGQRRHVLWVDQPAEDCSSEDTEPADLDLVNPSNGGNGTELLSENMRLDHFSVVPVADSDDLYKVDITIVYGDSDLIYVSDDPDDPVTCNYGFVGSEFCAVSSVSLILERRL